jgi:hypothetical protein
MEMMLLALVLAAVGPGPCDLIGRDAVARIESAPVVSTKESAGRSADVDRRSCFYQTDPFSKSVNLEWSRDAIPGGARRRWGEIFHAPAKEAEEGRGKERLPSPKPVAKVGEEAFWIPSRFGGAFFVLSGDSFVRVSLGGPGSEEERRDHARALAEKAIDSLRSRARLEDPH